MINRRLTSAEAADRLGVKPATLYAYVSRGLLHPERTPRGSFFDLREVVQLARTARNPGRPDGAAARSTRRAGVEPGGGDPLFVTELTLIEGGRLYYRGLDAVELARTRTFEETAGWLWTGEWEQGGTGWTVPPATAGPLARAMAWLPPGTAPVERFMTAVVAASACDQLRHDLNPAGVPVTGRSLLSVLAASLPRAGRGPGAGRGEGGERGDGSGRGQGEEGGEGGAGAGASPLSDRVWRGLTGRPVVAAGVAAVEAALVLAADHELAPSTLAARVAASFRADPYAVVLTGLGPASGSWHSGSTGAPSEVESLLGDAATTGPERAIGERLRRGAEVPHGFGMPLYPDGDPRAAELLSRLEGIGPPDRLEVVCRLVEVGRERGFPPPNFDLGLGALSYCAEMVPGAAQAMFTLGKVAGWLAHAIEEYTSPTRFRSRADYVGPPPETPESPGSPGVTESPEGAPAP
ncbi:MAG TPA: citrate/2-methylcitrate synthase [Acidimicrobiales bacterium]|nr:citrate/2-methylcitrate synthase [Acidimicrobiales bacterium]